MGSRGSVSRDSVIKRARKKMGLALENWIDLNLHESRDRTAARLGVTRQTLWRMFKGDIKLDIVKVREALGKKAADTVIEAMNDSIDDSE